MNKVEATEKLIDFVVENYLIDKEDIPLDKSLIDEGIIDSFGLIEIASFLEKEFSIVVADSDMIRDNFGSIQKIIDYVEKKKNA